MIKTLLLFLTALNFCNSLILNPFNILNPIKHEFIINKEIMVDINHRINIPLVDNIAKFIPNIDSNIGHNVVLLDKVIINGLINDHLLPSEVKKNIILLIIKITQEGDNIGAFVLSNYYNLVQHLL